MAIGALEKAGVKYSEIEPVFLAPADARAAFERGAVDAWVIWDPFLAAVQRQLLASLWPLLRPGGRLLYCTCSVFRAEGQNQLETFLAHNNDARLLPSPGHLHPGPDRISAALPDNQGRDGDGFFYALLEKTAP